MPARFTIAIPTHDRRETVVLAVRSALAQARAPEQVLVLCDGCTDGTAAAVLELGDPRVEALELPKVAAYGYEHRNRSLELARGDVISWLGDDDLLLPDHLLRIGELWDTGRYGLVQSHGAIVHPDDELEPFGGDWSVEDDREDLARFNPNPMSSVSVRVDVVRSVGGWDAGLPRRGDWDLWRRVLAAGAASAASPEPTVLHFRATGRSQEWADRVRQNEAWLARLGDTDQLTALRIALRRSRAQRDARERAWARETRTAVDWHQAELARVLARLRVLESGGGEPSPRRLRALLRRARRGG